MDGPLKSLLMLTVCAVALVPESGCKMFEPRTPPPVLPAVLPPNASLQQVIGAVNNNSMRIQSFATHDAELSGPGMPVKLKGTKIVFDRPKRLRIQAGTGFGTEVDVGSNNELFWFWVRRNEPPAVFFCRHDQYANCQAAQEMPIEPGWLIEALGIVEFHPHEHHDGPRRRPDGRLEVMTTRQTVCGPARKMTVIEPSTAAVVEQHLYDQQGRVTASAVVREHRLDPHSGLVMPKVVDLQSGRAQFSMRVDLGRVTVNVPPSNPDALWAMPAIAGSPLIDLADPAWQQNYAGQAPPQPTHRPAPQQEYTPTAGPARGYNRLR